MGRMIKNKKIMFIITSAITLLPIIAGLILWNRLPEELPTHWDASGNVNGYSGKAYAVFGMPLALTAVHLVCSFASFADPKTKNINEKIFGLVLWICPVMSIVCMTATYSQAFGYDIGVEFIMPFILGIIVMVIGNYMPKCKQNYTVGIKLPWTMNSEENWNKTHRLAGILWVIGGIIICVTSFLGNFMILFSVIMVIAIVPMVYSYLYYRKHERRSK